jgi:hypothetical protein
MILQLSKQSNPYFPDNIVLDMCIMPNTIDDTIHFKIIMTVIEYINNIKSSNDLTFNGNYNKLTKSLYVNEKCGSIKTDDFYMNKNIIVKNLFQDYILSNIDN